MAVVTELGSTTGKQSRPARNWTVSGALRELREWWTARRHRMITHQNTEPNLADVQAFVVPAPEWATHVDEAYLTSDEDGDLVWAWDDSPHHNLEAKWATYPELVPEKCWLN